jgi:hypothetical protein
LTAINNIPSEIEIPESKRAEMKENARINECLPDEIEVNAYTQIVSKYSHKNTIASYSA